MPALARFQAGKVRMIPPLTETPVRYPGQQFQQVIVDRGAGTRLRAAGSPPATSPAGTGRSLAMAQSGTAKLRQLRGL